MASGLVWFLAIIKHTEFVSCFCYMLTLLFVWLLKKIWILMQNPSVFNIVTKRYPLYTWVRWGTGGISLPKNQPPPPPLLGNFWKEGFFKKCRKEHVIFLYWLMVWHIQELNSLPLALIVDIAISDYNRLNKIPYRRLSFLIWRSRFYIF